MQHVDKYRRENCVNSSWSKITRMTIAHELDRSLCYRLKWEFCLIMKECSDIDNDTYTVEFLKGRATFGLGRRKGPLLFGLPFLSGSCHFRMIEKRLYCNS